MGFSDNAKAVIALTTPLGDRNRSPLSSIEWNRFSKALTEAGMEPGSIFASDFDPVLPGVPDDLVQSVRKLLRTAPAATVAAADLENKGIWTLTLVDIDYPTVFPERLAGLAPPVIFGVGSTSALARRGIAIVGSRKATEEGAKVAGDVARAAVDAGCTVVSGGGRGVDQFALNAAFTSGGRVVAMIADSLQARIRSPDILRALDSGNTTLVTQSTPESAATPASEMNCSRLIYAMGHVTLVIAADADSGSTWSGATEALEARNGTVVVWRGPGEGTGNARLVEMGAVAMHSPDDLPTLLDIHEAPIPQQLSLPDEAGPPQ